MVVQSMVRTINAPREARRTRRFTILSMCTDRWYQCQGAANRHAAEVCMVRMQRQGSTLHLMQSIVRRFRVQSIDKVGDAPLVVQSQVPHQKGSHDPVGAETVEVPQSSVIDMVNIPAFLVVQKIVEEWENSILRNGGESLLRQNFQQSATFSFTMSAGTSPCR